MDKYPITYEGVGCDFDHTVDLQRAELMEKYVLDNVDWGHHCMTERTINNESLS
jgi:hypothetical protein